MTVRALVTLVTFIWVCGVGSVTGSWGREISLVGEQLCHGDEIEVSIEFLAYAAFAFAVDVFKGGGVFEGFIAFFDGSASVIEVNESVERDGALGRRDAVGLHVAEGVRWRHEVQVDIVPVSLAEGGDRTLGDAEHRMDVALVQDGQECRGEGTAIKDHDIAG
ncbi:MAG: hypothetical protein OXC62_16350 [Aestuariivita sp.]|nr:hypothetical protein [Aestuariivita sp.]